MSEKQILTRRDFVRGTAGAVIGSSIIGIPQSESREARSSKVIVVRDAKAHEEVPKVNAEVVKKMLDETLQRVTGKETTKEALSSLVSPQDVIGLVTAPRIVPTHKELIEAFKASLVQAGIPAENIRNAQGRNVNLKEFTALINMPGLKAHWLTGIGTVLKNYILYSGKARDYHQENSAKLGEIWNLPDVKGKTKLVLVDALRPLCDKGPQFQPQFMWPYNGLIAGTDPVAVESVCLKIIMEKRKEIRGEEFPLSPPPLCVEAADTTYKLGTSKMEEIQIDASGWKEGLLL